MFVIPVVVFIFLVIIEFALKNKITDAFINAWLFITLIVWGSTEIFSLFNMWTTLTASITWVIILGVLLFVTIHKNIWKKFLFAIENKRGTWDEFKESRVYLCICIILVFSVAVLSLLRSQSLIDNLVHRLPRIMHWIQNKTVAPFATNSTRQIDYPSLTEYMNAQIYLLGGNDRIINIVQIGAYVCSGIIVSGICRKLGVNRKLALVSSLLYLLIPMTVIETCTTQTDVVAATYLLSFVYFILDYISADKLRMDKKGAISCVRIAICVMMGYLCKPTVCFSMIIFFVWMCIVRLYKRDNKVELLKYSLLGCLVALILLTPSSIRSYQIHEEKAGAEQENTIYTYGDQKKVINGVKDPSVFVMSCIQNLGTNASSRCFPQINELIVKVVKKIGYFLDYDFSKKEFLLLVGRESLGETHEPSPCIMWFGIGAWILIILRISKINITQFIYFVCATLGLFIQSGLMGYSYYRARYLLGVMATLCPAYAFVIQNLKGELCTKRNLAAAIIAISSLGTVNALSYELSYVVDGFKGEKVHQYFVGNNQPELYYDEITKFANVNGYTKIGIVGDIYYEYPLWQLINNLDRLEMVNVDDPYLEKYEDMDYIPECIFEESEEEIEIGDIMECHNVKYECVWRDYGNFNYYVAYLPLVQ